MTITATEYKTNLGKYFEWINQHSEDLYITKNGKTIAVMSNPNRKALNALEQLKSLSDFYDESLSKLSDEELIDMKVADKYGEYFD